MTTPAEQEAERRYIDEPDDIFETNVGWGKQLAREAFVAGAKWAWKKPPAHIRELLEAAREYRDNPSAQLEADELGLVGPATCAEDEIIGRLLAAAAALGEGRDEVQADPAG